MDLQLTVRGPPGISEDRPKARFHGSGAGGQPAPAWGKGVGVSGFVS